jgi:hypothetical protein
MRIGFFIGAGCPLAVRKVEDGKNLPLIPDIAGLTKAVREILEKHDDHKDSCKLIWERVEGRGIKEPTVARWLAT